MDTRFSTLPHSALVAVAECANVLARAQKVLAAKQEIADRAAARLRRSHVTADRLQRNMAAVRYGARP
jgi:hypothetical protein